MKKKTLALMLTLIAVLPSCNTLDKDDRPTRRLANPGDELSSNAWNRPHKSSHVGTPFGLPTSN